MPLNKLDNFIKNTEGRILYVSPADIDSTDSIENTGNSLARPFKTIQRALLESARFSYVKGRNNDETEKTTILLMPGEHVVDNRPGWYIFDDSGVKIRRPNSVSGAENIPADFTFSLNSNFDLTQSGNHLYRFNSVHGGVIVPRGTSIIGLDLRKTKVRPKYVPNPLKSYTDVPSSAIFRITGACYFWQFSVFDGNELDTVYTNNTNFDETNRSIPTFSHHKLTIFEYADGVNEVQSYGMTDLEMYYAKLSRAYGTGSGRDIDDKFPDDSAGFAPQRPEYEIVGAFADDPIKITSIQSGTGSGATNRITVTTNIPHGLSVNTPIRISGVSESRYNISTKVSEVDTTNPNIFYYNLTLTSQELQSLTRVPSINGLEAVTVETDTVSGASPYIFNISMRSVWGMNGMHADGSKATGFRSMVVAQFTGVSLQKDDRAFVKYKTSSRDYSDSLTINPDSSAPQLSSGSSSSGTVYHLDPDAIYRSGWETSHIKVSNDAFIQVVSVFAIGYNKHFDIRSGADASITNSNSNFGQISLSSDGFKKEAFDKDNKAYLTHIISPRAITGSEENVDWLTLDITNTLANAVNTRLYLNGFTSEDIVPPVLTQGYRIGARLNDKLYVDIDRTTYSADILMDDGSSSVKEYSVGTPSNNVFTTTASHSLTTGEKVVVTSDSGDLPENLKTNTVYFVRKESSNTLKLAATKQDAINDSPIIVSGGTNVKVLSRVSDKNAGDVANPVQWDAGNSQWYVTTNAGSDIYSNLSGTGASSATYVKRTADTRSLDEKIYKLRVVIPKETQNAKIPDNGFVIQESSSTGYRGTDNTDSNKTTITAADYDFNRNLRFISTCSYSDPTVTVRTELPHNLTTGDSVIIRNVTDDAINTGIGTFNKGYNGTFEVSVVDDMTFTYSKALAGLGGFTNNTGIRTDVSPRFERNDLQSNFYVYRNEIIQEYEEGIRDGVYHLYVANAGNAINTEFTDLKYSQNVVDLYPQLDRDNINDNPLPAKSYAKVSPLGEVVTNDLKKSITRETVDIFSTKLGFGLEIFDVDNTTAGVSTITFARNHGLNGVIEGTLTAGTSNRNAAGTYYNVKLLTGGSSGSWDGATAKVTLTGSAGSGAISAFEIQSTGSGYASENTLYFDTTDIGGSNDAYITLAAAGIISNVYDVVQFTGAGTTSDTYHRISGVGATNQISIARTTGDPVITSDHYAYVVGPSIAFTADTATGIVTATAHGLFSGNKVRVLDSSNNNTGDFIISSKVGVNTVTISGITATSGYLLKHAYSSNSGISDNNGENLGKRAFAIYGGDTLTATATVGIDTTLIPVSHSGVGTMSRFSLGSYVQVDDEIMRVANSTLQGQDNDQLVVIRGSLATGISSHQSGSILKKVEPKAIEFRRPSYVRASGHTFEYLGYGPGNYSTGLPQVQVKSLTEREDFLVQSQERSAGIVVYTAMNNKGDFFIGNQKKSSATGEETTFDTPVPTVTGEDPSRLSSVFDEVTIKERIVVEGGDSGQVLSQFDGPVTFTGETRFTNVSKITNETDSTSPTSGALQVSGGIGVGKTLVATNIKVGTVHLKSSANEVTATDGNDLKLNAPTGQVVAIQTNTTISGILSVTDDITAFWVSDERLKDNITAIDDPLAKVVSISGNTFDWNEKSNKSGHDVGLIAQEIEKVLPEAVTTRDNGYLAVDYHKVVPLLVEAIKELSGKVEALEQKLSDK